jgi:hypothetical protein
MVIDTRLDDVNYTKNVDVDTIRWQFLDPHIGTHEPSAQFEPFEFETEGTCKSFQ